MANRALVVTGDGFGDMELYYPLYRLEEAGRGAGAAGAGVIKGIHGYMVRRTLSGREIFNILNLSVLTH